MAVWSKNFCARFEETRSGCNCARIALGRKLVDAVAEFSSLEFLIAAMIAKVSLLCKPRLVIFEIIVVRDSYKLFAGSVMRS
jgi:hypothetical protein